MKPEPLKDRAYVMAGKGHLYHVAQIKSACEYLKKELCECNKTCNLLNKHLVEKAFQDIYKEKE